MLALTDRTRPVVVIALVVGAFVLTTITRAVTRVVVRRVASRSPRWFRTRARRPGAETAEAGERRRHQRTEAATLMLHHILALVIWIAVLIAIFHTLDLDAAFFISSAGFLGVGLAVGGQNKVNDYFTGLSVLLEDRYGVGDQIEGSTGFAEPVRGVVEHIGLVTTRVREDASTVHVPHGVLSTVRNLSQEPIEPMPVA